MRFFPAGGSETLPPPHHKLAGRGWRRATKSGYLPPHGLPSFWQTIHSILPDPPVVPILLHETLPRLSLSRDVMGRSPFLAASEGAFSMAAKHGSHREKLFKILFCILGFGWTHARSTKHRFLAVLLSWGGGGTSMGQACSLYRPFSSINLIFCCLPAGCY